MKSCDIFVYTKSRFAYLIQISMKSTGKFVYAYGKFRMFLLLQDIYSNKIVVAMQNWIMLYYWITHFSQSYDQYLLWISYANMEVSRIFLSQTF